MFITSNFVRPLKSDPPSIYETTTPDDFTSSQRNQGARRIILKIAPCNTKDIATKRTILKLTLRPSSESSNSSNDHTKPQVAKQRSFTVRIGREEEVFEEVSSEDDTKLKQDHPSKRRRLSKSEGVAVSVVGASPSLKVNNAGTSSVSALAPGIIDEGSKATRPKDRESSKRDHPSKRLKQLRAEHK